MSRKLNLLYAKAFWFVGTLSSVGWTRYQVLIVLSLPTLRMHCPDSINVCATKNNFYLDNGLTAYEIGSLKSFGLLLKLFGEPLWSTIADLTDPRAVYALCILVQIVSMEKLRTTHPLTVPLVFYIKLFRSITSTSSNIITAVCFHLTEGSGEGYGRQRMFGGIAWGLGAYVAGSLIDGYGMLALFAYTYFFIACNFLLVLVAFPPKSQPPTHENPKTSSLLSQLCLNASSFIKAIRQFFDHKPCRVVLLSSMVFGAVMTVPDTFLYISLEKDFHASRSFSGWMTIVSILSELPIFWYSDYIIASMGHYNMKVVAFGSLALRLLMLSVCSPSLPFSLHIIIASQLIHGINFGMFWVAASDAIYKLAPDHLLTSSMASLNMAYFTCGGTIGNYLWGWLYEWTGGVTSLYVCATGIIYIMLFVLRSSSAESTLREGLVRKSEADKTDDLIVDP